MTSPLPERPNLEQLKRQAKDLLAATRATDPGARHASRSRFRVLPACVGKSETELAALPFALHDAQSVIAREHGFPSWNALREHVEALTLAFDDAVNDFLGCALDGRSGRARRLLASHPAIAQANFHTALVLGDIATVEIHLAKNPALATQRGGPRAWEPLLYVCMTTVAHEEIASAAGLVTIAQRLLALGANPNTSFPWQDDPSAPLPVLWGATCVARVLPLAQLLLDAGANPNDGESVYHSAEHGDIAMLDLLHAHGAHVDGGDNRWGNTPLYFILGHTDDSGRSDDVRRGIRWLLDHGADPNRVCYPDKSAETALHAAARNWDVPMVELLVQHGAQIRARRADGRTAFALASLHGNHPVAEWLQAHEGGDELTSGERFVAACTRGDRAKAESMLRGSPNLRGAIASNPHAQRLLIKVASRGDIRALETMLACGFDVHTTDDIGATALHYAALAGQSEAVRTLLAHGAKVDVRDKNYDAPPLGWCDYGSVQMRRPNGDYVGVAKALLRAGAAMDGEESGYADDVHAAWADVRNETAPPQ